MNFWEIVRKEPRKKKYETQIKKSSSISPSPSHLRIFPSHFFNYCSRIFAPKARAEVVPTEHHKTLSTVIIYRCTNMPLFTNYAFIYELTLSLSQFFSLCLSLFLLVFVLEQFCSIFSKGTREVIPLLVRKGLYYNWNTVLHWRYSSKRSLRRNMKR